MTHAVTLYEISDFINVDRVVDPDSVKYWYEGICPQTHTVLTLPRTALAEAIAQGLMRQLAADESYSHEGKMYGVLVVKAPLGLRVLKAFSGLLQGSAVVEGWVPPIPGRDRIALAETQTLEELETIKQQLLTLQHLPVRQEFTARSHQFEVQLHQLKQQQQQQKYLRQQQRQQLTATLTDSTLAITPEGELLRIALNELDDCSRHEGMEQRRFKQERDRTLQPLKQTIEQADLQMRGLKQRRKELSRQLQAQMHEIYSLTNFAGQSRSLQQIIAQGALPTGTGDCCAPKLLHYAAIQGFQPLAMAEFWWGQPSSNRDKTPGKFYGACVERCQPIMGFLLSGIQTTFLTEDLSIVYEDEWLVVVNKPSGLLSVPGRSSNRQDCVVNRMQLLFPSTTLRAVHRLDQDTSGILVLVRDQQTHRAMAQLFQQRQVHKVYEAVLAGTVTPEQGTIDLPLWGNPGDRPRQTIDYQHGKPSVTQFRVLNQAENLTRIEFIPLTGRTHQLRVHAADERGLGIAILGDRLYGNADRNGEGRLHLHARELCFEHPHLKQSIHWQTIVPF